jgi:hypothetical protein
MREIDIHSTVLGLEVVKELLRDCPEVYADMEDAAMQHIFQAMMDVNMPMSEVAALLRVNVDEAAAKMKKVREASS